MLLMQLSTQNLKFLHSLQLAEAKVLLKIGNLVQNTLLLYHNILYSSFLPKKNPGIRGMNFSSNHLLSFV